MFGACTCLVVAASHSTLAVSLLKHVVPIEGVEIVFVVVVVDLFNLEL